jgi:hypothetical protein
MSGRPKTDFEKPSGLEEVEICALSGKLPSDHCGERLSEFFVSGTAPREKDDYYKLYNINLLNGHIVPPACVSGFPAAQVGQKALVDYPSVLQKWAAQKELQLPPVDHCGAESGYTDGYADGYAVGEAGGYSGSQQSPGVAAFFIDNPVNNDEYMLQSSLPLKDQRIPLRVNAPPQTVKVIFYIDGGNSELNGSVGAVAAEVTEAPFTYLWPPVKGTHSLKAKAVLPGGKELEQSISFTVK